MKTITPGASLKPGFVELSAYWNGTIMFINTMTIVAYNELVELLKKDYIPKEDVDEVIEYLNDVERSHFNSENGRGVYEIDMREATKHLCMINDLVNNKEVIPDNDMFGLLIMAMPQKRTGNSNITKPKNKKRK
jgi:hypothetical protein